MRAALPLILIHNLSGGRIVIRNIVNKLIKDNLAPEFETNLFGVAFVSSSCRVSYVIRIVLSLLLEMCVVILNVLSWMLFCYINVMFFCAFQCVGMSFHDLLDVRSCVLCLFLMLSEFECSLSVCIIVVSMFQLLFVLFS